MYHWLNASKPLDSILQCIYDAYESEAEMVEIPESLRMSKDVRDSREASELKGYRSKNRYKDQT
jgi:tRNA dimethylallyltransferase